MVESSVSSINRSLPCWEIQVNIEVYSSTFFTHPEVLMIWLYSRVIVLDHSEEKDSKWICLRLKARAMQRNPNPESRKFFACWIWNLGNFDGGIRDPGLWNSESTGLSWTPLYGATRRCSPQIPEETGIHCWLYFIYLGSVISGEDGSRGDILK